MAGFPAHLPIPSFFSPPCAAMLVAKLLQLPWLCFWDATGPLGLSACPSVAVVLARPRSAVLFGASSCSPRWMRPLWGRHWGQAVSHCHRHPIASCRWLRWAKRGCRDAGGAASAWQGGGIACPSHGGLQVALFLRRLAAVSCWRQPAFTLTRGTCGVSSARL